MSVTPSPSRSFKLAKSIPKVSFSFSASKFPSVSEISCDDFTVPSEFKNKICTAPILLFSEPGE